MSKIITIVGGGIIGCAIAYELSKDSDEVILIEKNSKIRGENQSSRNSGVIHAGIYYPKYLGPLKSKFCVEGNKMLYKFCEKHNIPHKKTGKLIISTNLIEDEYLNDVLKIAKENNVPDIKLINSEEINKIEPNVKANSALHIPTSGIVEPTELVSRLHMLAESNNVSFATGTEVMNIISRKEGFTIETKLESFETDMLINAAGLYSDEIAKMINPDSHYKISPLRGESAKFYQTRENISMKGLNVYPTPHGVLPNGEKLEASFEEFQRLFKKGEVSKTVGVHLTPTFELIDGEYTISNTVTIGPYYAGQVEKEDYHPIIKEKDYLNKINNFFPNIKLEDISLHQTGIYAKLENHYDFVIERDSKYSRCINLLGIDSPGLTSSLAIAKHVGELIRE